MQPLIRKHSYLNNRYPVGSMPGGGGGATDQNLEHLQKAVFLCWSFLEVYIFATTYWKAFLVGPKVPYPNTPAGNKLEGDWGEIVALGAEISP